LISGADASKCIQPTANEAIDSLVMGIKKEDADFIKRFLSKVDTSYIKSHQIKDAYKSIIKAILFFEFLNNPKHLNITDSKTKKPLTYLDVFGELMS